MTRGVVPYTIAGGVPARSIRDRIPKAMIDRFIALAWRNHDLGGINREASFSNPEAMLALVEQHVAAGALPALAPRRYRIERKKGADARIVPLAEGNA